MNKDQPSGEPISPTGVNIQTLTSWKRLNAPATPGSASPQVDLDDVYERLKKELDKSSDNKKTTIKNGSSSTGSSPHPIPSKRDFIPSYPAPNPPNNSLSPRSSERMRSPDSSGPTIQDILPQTATSGEEVVIKGRHFTSRVSVKIDNRKTEVINVTPSTIKILIPDFPSDCKSGPKTVEVICSPAVSPTIKPKAAQKVQGKLRRIHTIGKFGSSSVSTSTEEGVENRGDGDDMDIGSYSTKVDNMFNYLSKPHPLSNSDSVKIKDGGRDKRREALQGAGKTVKLQKGGFFFNQATSSNTVPTVGFIGSSPRNESALESEGTEYSDDKGSEKLAEDLDQRDPLPRILRVILDSEVNSEYRKRIREQKRTKEEGSDNDKKDDNMLIRALKKLARDQEETVCWSELIMIREREQGEDISDVGATPRIHIPEVVDRKIKEWFWKDLTFGDVWKCVKSISSGLRQFLVPHINNNESEKSVNNNNIVVCSRAGMMWSLLELSLSRLGLTSIYLGSVHAEEGILSPADMIKIILDTQSKILVVDTLSNLNSIIPSESQDKSITDALSALSAIIILEKKPNGKLNKEDPIYSKTVFIDDVIKMRKKKQGSALNTCKTFGQGSMVTITQGVESGARGLLQDTQHLCKITNDVISRYNITEQDVLLFGRAGKSEGAPPIVHVIGRIFSVLLPFLAGCKTFFLDSNSLCASLHFTEYLRHIQPTVIVSASGLWNFIAGTLARSSRIDSEALVVNKEWKYCLGLSRLRYGLTGYSWIPPELIQSLKECGVTLCVNYGLSEAGGILTLQDKTTTDTLGTSTAFHETPVGRPLVTDLMRIGSNNEIQVNLALLKHGIAKQIFEIGNYNSSTKTEKEQNQVDKQEESSSWWNTGDLGVLNEETGELMLWGRVQNVVRITDKVITPLDKMEEFLGFYVDIVGSVLVTEEEGKFMVLIWMNKSKLEQMAKEQQPEINVKAMFEGEKIKELSGKVQEGLVKVNQIIKDSGMQPSREGKANISVEEGGEIVLRRFTILKNKWIEQGKGEVCWAGKMRRSVVLENMKTVIQRMRTPQIPPFK